MASKSCVIVTKYFLFVFNLFFFFLGGVTLGFGLWILFDKTSFIAVLDTTSVPLQIWSYLLSGLGIFTMMMGFLGCIGALKEVKCMLGIIEKKISEAVENLIKNYNRDDNKLENLEETWDFIQLKFSCCGWNSFDEWLNNPIVRRNISKESMANFDTQFNFPCSCYNSSKNFTHNVTKETGFCLTYGNNQLENSQGCKRIVFQWMQQNTVTIMIICLGITMVESFLPGILASSLGCRYRCYCVGTSTPIMTNSFAFSKRESLRPSVEGLKPSLFISLLSFFLTILLQVHIESLKGFDWDQHFRNGTTY
ncbi:CD82 antigen-like isoform X2 [Narcine bancroftii]|uniref:CD82 antigen-like isoform X2 n=1 Tax=Narcine bancroftii TaxID=1343680 RepID=UPI00383174D9